MPRFGPFRALRYDLANVDLADVAAPPYDVISPDGRAQLLARHRRNVVAIDLPEGPDAYEGAARAMEDWIAEGTLVEDDQPHLYIYRMSHRDDAGALRRTTGVLGELELVRPGEDVGAGTAPILPHEETTRKAKSDRLALTRTTKANLSPIWGLSPAAGLSKLLEPAHAPDASWTDEEGVSHEFWTLSDPEAIRAIGEAVSAEPIVIADGHHRFETSLTYRDERRAQVPGGSDGPWDAALFYVVELVADELTVLPIHRLVRGLPADFDLVEALGELYELEPETTSGAPSLVTTRGRWTMTPRPGAFDGVRDLGTSRLAHALDLLPAHELVYQHGEAEAVGQVLDGAFQAAFLVEPASVDQILEVARGGDRMPPKTTFFHPKPRTGIVFRRAG